MSHSINVQKALSHKGGVIQYKALSQKEDITHYKPKGSIISQRGRHTVYTYIKHYLVRRTSHSINLQKALFRKKDVTQINLQKALSRKEDVTLYKPTESIIS